MEKVPSCRRTSCPNAAKMAFWRRLLAGSDWSHLLSVLSPSFFDVMSARELSVRAAELARNWFDREQYLSQVVALGENLALLDIGVTVVSAKPVRSVIPFRAEPLNLIECPKAADGTALLRLFFLQIAISDVVFLDLRESRFCRCAETGKIAFHPLPLWSRWRPDFVEGIRRLYAGFYEEQPGQFEQATRELGVSAANDVFFRAFGGARKHASSYALSEFRETFHEVFVRCRDAKAALHPDFVTLGVMLATLYDHLESLGGTYDVQAAYEAVTLAVAADSGASADGIAVDSRK